MNLLQASYLKVQSDIHAGGPGSGRRPGGGLGKQTPLKDWKQKKDKPVHQGAHQKLIAKGYKHTGNGKDNSTGQSYSHYIKSKGKSDYDVREVTPDGKINNPFKGGM